MANIKSQKKRIVTNEANRQRNMAVRSRMKTLAKQASAAIDAKNKDAAGKAMTEALSAIDRAASKGVIHRNAAARKKSALMHQAAAL